jgi:hypothetical protein
VPGSASEKNTFYLLKEERSRKRRRNRTPPAGASDTEIGSKRRKKPVTNPDSGKSEKKRFLSRAFNRKRNPA